MNTSRNFQLYIIFSISKLKIPGLISLLMALISATELITRYYSNEKLAQCCFKVRPTSATLADIKPTFGKCAVLAGKALTVNMLEVNCFQTPMVTQPFVSQHKAHIRE